MRDVEIDVTVDVVDVADALVVVVERVAVVPVVLAGRMVAVADVIVQIIVVPVAIGCFRGCR